MEITHSGVTGGLVVVNRADWEVSIALIHAPIPRQQTKEDPAWDRIRKIFNHECGIRSCPGNIYMKEM